MTLYLLKYCLPVLLGYTLFIGLAGRMNPFVKPEYPEERPSWFLGVWTGLTIALVLGVGMHLTYPMPLDSAKALLPHTAFFLCALLLPGFAGYSLYRRHVSREMRGTGFAMAQDDNVLKHRLESDSRWRENEKLSMHPELTGAAFEQPPTQSTSSHSDLHTNADEYAPIIASFLDSAELQVLDTHKEPAANSEPEEAFEAHLGTDFDTDNETSLDDYLDDTVFEGFHYSDLDLDASELDATRLIDMSDISGIQIADLADSEDSELALFDETEFTQAIEFTDTEQSLPSMELTEDQLDATHEDFMLPRDTAFDGSAHEPTTEFPCSDNDDSLLPQPTQYPGAAKPAAAINGSHATSVSNLQLGQRLSDELAAHEETSRQLRITRKVLARLTPSAQESAFPKPDETEDKDSLINLKEELADSLALQASQLSQLNSEKEKRLQSEEACSRMQQDLIQAKHDIRRSSAARAKALSTANKAIAFARQTLQVRALLEEELQMARNTLSKRQDTISSIIKELENEKERTQEEVAYMAQQLVVHDHLPKHHHDDELERSGMEHALPSTSNGKMTEAHQIGPEL